MHYRVPSFRSGFLPQRALERRVKQINEATALGVEPQGGVIVHGTQLLQARVKRR